MITMQALSPSQKIMTLLLFLSTGLLFAQKDTLNTEKLIIVKAYSPTVSDAIKIKQTPVQQPDSMIAKKKVVTYHIFSVPVASTFKPYKGRAAGISKQSRPQHYDNYAALGIGNYTNLMAEFYGKINLSQRQDLGITLNHHSSQGGLKKARVDDNYANTRIGLTYTQREEDFLWDAKIGFLHQAFNWYGIPEDAIPEIPDGLDPKHQYTGIKVGGNVKFKKGIFNALSLNYLHFGDNFKSSEDHVVISPKLQIPVGTDNINIDLGFDYLNGKFSDLDLLTYKYGFLNLSVAPNYRIVTDQFSIKLGAKIVYSSAIENGKNHFYIYPDLKASYRIAGDYFIVYGGIKGDLTQQTYYHFTQRNPFLAPGLIIAPTNEPFNFFVGATGKFTEKLGYNFRLNYRSAKDKPLFYHQPQISGLANQRPYGYANSFSILYDKVKTLSLYGKLDYTINRDFTAGVALTYANYSTDKQPEAWNLPTIKATLFGDYQINKKWAAAAHFYFMGQRKDLLSTEDLSTSGSVDLDSFLDANLRLNYQLNDHWGFFLRGNNLFGNHYDYWYAYPVQGIQGMVGASYQF